MEDINTKIYAATITLQNKAWELLPSKCKNWVENWIWDRTDDEIYFHLEKLPKLWN